MMILLTDNARGKMNYNNRMFTVMRLLVFTVNINYILSSVEN